MKFFELLWDVIRHLNDEEKWNALIQFVGPAKVYALLFAIVFCETGLVILPFLPGDSLLFAIGAMAGLGVFNLPLAMGLLIVAALLGDNVNYNIGKRLGPAVFSRDLDETTSPVSNDPNKLDYLTKKKRRSIFDRLLNRKHLEKAQAFYEKYGAKTIILARFVPIVRTFAPFVAGVGRMSYPKFLFYSVIGAIGWVVICTSAGYFFGRIEFVKKNFELVLLMVIAISLLPVMIEIILGYRRSKRGVDPLLDVVTLGESAEKEEAGDLK